MSLNDKDPIETKTTYYEKKIGKTLYRVTNVYKGDIDLTKAIEEFTVQKILKDEDNSKLYM